MRERSTMHVGDCREVMAAMAADSIDAIVTDPPYGLTANKAGGSGVASINLETPYGRARIGTGNGGGGFMGMAWDHGVPGIEFWTAALRVAKPGAHMLAFGGTRTFHRLTCAIEDAGWEIRDCIMWVYSTGFPKSLDVGKATDKAAGVERLPTGTEPRRPNPRAMQPNGDGLRACDAATRYDEPATDAAKQWDGWGTALKPAFEPIIVARKPLAGTVAENVQRFGTGAINVDACRIGTDKRWPSSESKFSGWQKSGESMPSEPRGDGRWPANLILSYPEEEYELRADLTADQRSDLYGWLSANA